MISLRLPLAIATLIVLTSISLACNIPVFRYALERWKPDVCEVLVFHDGPLSSQDAALISQWEARCTSESGHPNATILRRDIAIDGEHLELWQELAPSASARLPHVLVRTKLGTGRTVNHWHGSISEAQEISIFESPLRDELRRRLLAGHSVVWLLVRSADEQRNADVRSQVESNFDALSRTIQLPEGVGLPGSELYADVPLVVKFSLLELDPQDPREKFLLALLTVVRQREYAEGEPLLVPVFGRGRALEVIPASDLSSHLMHDLTFFLSGACSCQVKERNPGFDLLMHADWDGALFGDGDENRPPDRTAEEGQNRGPVLLQIPQGSPKGTNK